MDSIFRFFIILRRFYMRFLIFIFSTTLLNPTISTAAESRLHEKAERIKARSRLLSASALTLVPLAYAYLQDSKPISQEKSAYTEDVLKTDGLSSNNAFQNEPSLPIFEQRIGDSEFLIPYGTVDSLQWKRLNLPYLPEGLIKTDTQFIINSNNALCSIVVFSGVTNAGKRTAMIVSTNTQTGYMEIQTLDLNHSMIQLQQFSKDHAVLSLQLISTTEPETQQNGLILEIGDNLSQIKSYSTESINSPLTLESMDSYGFTNTDGLKHI